MSFLPTPGNRIKFARSILRLTRREFEQLHEISVNTLQSWESDKNDLTKKGAQKLNNAFVKSGLLCTEDWLMTGKGQLPTLLENAFELPNKFDEDFCILREIEAFKAINPDPIVVIMSDNGMEPLYCIGEYVGGNKKHNEQINSLIGENCIIETTAGDVLVRKILSGSRNQVFNLACINISTNQVPVIPDIKIKFAAKIIMHRKKEES